MSDKPSVPQNPGEPSKASLDEGETPNESTLVEESTSGIGEEGRSQEDVETQMKTSESSLQDGSDNPHKDKSNELKILDEERLRDIFTRPDGEQPRAGGLGSPSEESEELRRRSAPALEQVLNQAGAIVGYKTQSTELLLQMTDALLAEMETSSASSIGSDETVSMQDAYAGRLTHPHFDPTNKEVPPVVADSRTSPMTIGDSSDEGPPSNDPDYSPTTSTRKGVETEMGESAFADSEGSPTGEQKSTRKNTACISRTRYKGDVRETSNYSSEDSPERTCKAFKIRHNPEKTSSSESSGDSAVEDASETCTDVQVPMDSSVDSSESRSSESDYPRPVTGSEDETEDGLPDADIGNSDPGVSKRQRESEGDDGCQ